MSVHRKMTQILQTHPFTFLALFGAGWGTTFIEILPVAIQIVGGVIALLIGALKAFNSLEDLLAKRAKRMVRQERDHELVRRIRERADKNGGEYDEEIDSLIEDIADN